MKKIPLYKMLEMTGLLLFLVAFISRLYFDLSTALYYTALGALILLFLYANSLKKHS
ncbi:hypothetical protein C8E01_104213 [Pontibacter virosus]|uniref:Uncharacterized protein n=1 Tax=Pontibacter virosus TaxID=1765052 RepID=A0A2U1AZT0_9BACT|nr:hypothetical protein C8E01_104213 [Pontibacter virosus]